MSSLVLLSLSIGSYATAQELGTAGAVRKLADIQNRAMEMEAAYNQARKITLLDPIPNLPLPQHEDSLDLGTLTRGQVGRLAYWNFKVADVVDSQNVILSVGSNKRVWLEGYPTDGFVSDQAVRIIDFVEVTGTKSYETVAGSSLTVWVVKLLPKEETEKRLAADIAKGIEDGEMRVWTAKNGKTAAGKFREIKSSKVTIEQRDGTRLSFPLSALVDEDRDLAMKLSKEKRTRKNSD
jgi:hypothetical protein